MKTIKENAFVSSKYIYKLLCIVSFLTISAIAIISKEPSVGYEISIYAQYELYFWGSVLFGFAISVVITQIPIRSPKIREKYWLLGFFSIILVWLVVLFLPLSRGYTIYGRGDVLTHAGYIKDIFEQGSFPSHNFYPLLHIWGIIIISVTKVSIGDTATLVPAFTSIVFVLGIVIFLKRVLTTTSTVLMLPLASLLMYKQSHTIFAPSIVSFYLYPFVVYAYIFQKRTDNIGISICLLVLLCSILFYHPITALFTILTMGLYEFVTRLHFSAGGSPLSNITESGSVPNYLVFLLTSFFAWYILYTNFRGFIIVLVKRVTQGIGGSSLQSTAGVVSRTSPKLVDLARIGLLKYGDIALLTFFASIAILIYIYIIKSEDGKIGATVWFFIVLSIVFLGFSAISYLVDITIGFERIVKYLRYSTTILLSVLIGRVGFRKSNFSRVSAFSIFFILLIISLLTLYPAPLSISPNQQTTDMEIEGADWMLEYQENHNLYRLGISMYRMDDYLHGQEERNSLKETERTPPAHLGYSHENRVSSFSESRSYLIITKMGKIRKMKLYPGYERFWRFTPTDFKKLSQDPTMSKIYANGEFKAYQRATGAQ